MTRPVGRWRGAAAIAIAALGSGASARADPASDAAARVQVAPPPPAESTSPSAVTPLPPAPEAQAPPLEVAFAGGVGLSAAFIDWERPTASGARDGDFRFSVLRLGARAKYDAIQLEFEWRIYPHYQFLRHAFVGYRASDALAFDLGVSRVPFGLLPFASNSWFFGLPYYLGMEDDADFGLRAHWTPGDWDFWFSFYKNSEGSYFGNSLDSARFSYDAVQATAEELAGSGIAGPRNDRETNTVAARAAYDLHAGDFAAELGASARVGLLQDLVTGERSVNWAVSPHARLSYGPAELALEAIAYRYAPHAGPGDDPRLLALGAFDAPYAVARRGTVLVANFSWGFPVKWGPISIVKVFFDTGQLFKWARSFRDSRQIVFGSYLIAGPVYFTVDFAFGQHHPWIGPSYASAFAAGAADSRFYNWTNVNLGFSY